MNIPKPRSISIPDDLWYIVQSVAKDQNITASALIRILIEIALKPNRKKKRG